MAKQGNPLKLLEKNRGGGGGGGKNLGTVG